MRKLSSVIVFMLVVLGLNAQVTGFVYEENEGNKKPLFGVNIYWNNTSLGTTSSNDGKFTIEMPTNSNKLIFSFVGYETDTIIVKNKNQQIKSSTQKQSSAR